MGPWRGQPWKPGPNPHPVVPLAAAPEAFEAVHLGFDGQNSLLFRKDADFSDSEESLDLRDRLAEPVPQLGLDLPDGRHRIRPGQPPIKVDPEPGLSHVRGGDPGLYPLDLRPAGLVLGVLDGRVAVLAA